LVEQVNKKGRDKKAANRMKKGSSSKGKQRDTSNDEEGRNPGIEGVPHSSSTSAKSDPSQRVDLVVEDTAAEDTERVRARKEGSSGWNNDPKRFV
jgi:hypothetical protein